MTRTGLASISGMNVMAKSIALLVSGLAFLPTIAAAQAADDLESIPAALQGIWGKHGRCDIPADRLTITSQTAGWGDGPFDPVVYDPDEQAIHWDREYDVDNFVRGGSPDVLVHNTEGFHMPGQMVYARCGPRMARVLPWPPFKPGPVVRDPGGQPGHGASVR